MWDLLSGMLIPILKIIFEMREGKKISDADFIKYVLAHQQRRSLAGISAVEANEVLEAKIKEMSEKE